MDEQVISPLLGPLRNTDPDHWWESEPVAVAFFDGKKLPITYQFSPGEDPDFLRDADAAVENFLRLTAGYRLDISPHVFEYADLCVANTDPDCFEPWVLDLIKSPEPPQKVWKLVQDVRRIIVERRGSRGDNDVYVAVSLDCTWEDHGLLLVFRQGRKLTRVNVPDGWLTEMDAFGTPEEKDTLWSEF